LMEKIKVLAIDDEPSQQGLTKIFLEGMKDISVEVAGSGKEGLAMIDAGEFDVIVSDYLMPSMDGLQLLRMLQERNCDVPFILFTGKGREDVAVNALNLGASFYLQKGCDPETEYTELANMIRRSSENFRTKKTLQESEIKFRALAEATTEGLMFHDGGIIVDCNPQFAHLFGYEPEEIVGRNGFDFMMSAETRDAILQWLYEGAKGRIDFIGIKKDGSQICAETSAFPMVRNGKTNICVQMYDITERKRVEGALKESEGLYHTLFDKSPFPISLNDISGKFVDVNEKLLEVYGITKEQILNKGPNEMGFIDANGFQEMTEALLESGGIVNQRPMVVKHPDGRNRHVLISARLIKYKGENHVLSVSDDVTDLVETKKELQVICAELDWERKRSK
jgi:PAS domain S-box-containing protein